MEQARFYDGEQARPLDVLLDVSILEMNIRAADGHGILKSWLWADTVVVNPPGDGLVGTLSHKIDGDCRLIVTDDVWKRAIEPHLPKHQRLPGLPIVLALCVASVAFLAALIFASPEVLDVAARFVPSAWEDTLGTYAAAEMSEGKTCKGTPVGRATLARLAQSFDGEGHKIDVQVVDLPTVNAISLPGRHIIIFNGLLKETRTGDELAGVLAHEVGHQHYHHPMRIFLQSTGGSLLLGLALGNAAVVSQAVTAAHELLILKGGREFELQADAYAASALARNHMETGSLMVFLNAIAKKYPENDSTPEWMNSHPVTEARVEALNKEIAGLKKTGPTHPAMTADEWAAVRNYCRH